MHHSPAKYRFSIGPWNISEGRDPYGPDTRPAKDFAWKLERFKTGGFDAVMFHDDDDRGDAEELFEFADGVLAGAVQPKLSPMQEAHL